MTSAKWLAFFATTALRVTPVGLSSLEGDSRLAALYFAGGHRSPSPLVSESRIGVRTSNDRGARVAMLGGSQQGRRTAWVG